MINISPIKGKGKVITTEYKESEFYVRLVCFTWNEEYGQRLGCCYSCSLSGGFCGATPVDKAANLKKQRMKQSRKEKEWRDGHACVLFSQAFGKLDDDLVRQKKDTKVKQQ